MFSNTGSTLLRRSSESLASKQSINHQLYRSVGNKWRGGCIASQERSFNTAAPNQASPSLVLSRRQDNRLHIFLPTKPQIADNDAKKCLILSPIHCRADGDANTVAKPGVPDQDETLLVTPEMISKEIERHYFLGSSNLQQQFVGGMGEGDGGVWFTPRHLLAPEPLMHYEELMRDTIALVKEKRPGITFGLYTSGLVNGSTSMDVIDRLGKGGIGLSCGEVSLLGGDPVSYLNVTEGVDGSASTVEKNAFGNVCAFIGMASEKGFPITAALADGPGNRSGKDLAKSLGALSTQTYQLPVDEGTICL